MPSKQELYRANNAYMFAILIAGMCGGFLTGLILQVYRMKDFSILSMVEVIWSGLMMMIFGAPWILIPLMLVLYPLAMGLYFLLPRVLSPNQRNFMLVSVMVYCCFVVIANWLGWYEVAVNLRDTASLAPTFIAAIVFGYFFHKFSQKRPD